MMNLMRKPMRAKNIFPRLCVCLLFTLAFANLAALALDNMIYNNLSRSRQALLDQRQHLQESADRIGRQLDALNRQMDTVNSYLRDTDSALRDVETSLSQIH
jgi:septal ring factor EnvC (AmiA/AmiB activator)